MLLWQKLSNYKKLTQMKTEDILTTAQKAFRAKKFSKVISLLEPKSIEYRDSYEFYYILGVSCMYLKDFGGAEAYFKGARRIKLNSPDLTTAQGTLYLQRGYTSRAVEYYLEALDYDNNNKTAKKALKFIQKHIKDDNISGLVRKGKINKFFPKTGIHPFIVPACIICLILAFCGTYFALNYSKILGLNGTRADLTELFLSSDEKISPLETNLSNCRYILNSSDVPKIYAEAQSLFQQSKDNEALVKINTLLNSNASISIKHKSNQLKEYISGSEPDFANFKNDFSVNEIQEDIYLYKDCWVLWSGRVANEEITPTFYFAELLVGYEDMKKLDAKVPIQILQPITINSSLPIQVLARVIIKDGNLALDVKSVHQPLQK